MEDKSRKHQVLDGQAREIIFRVYKSFKSEAEAGEPLTDVAKARERAARACGVSERSVQRIVSEAKKFLENSNGSVQVKFKLPKFKRNRSKPITGLDDLKKDFLRRTIFDMNAAGEFPSTNKLIIKMKGTAGFRGSQTSMGRILKDMGFKYVKCNDGRKILMQVRCDHASRHHSEGESVKTALNAIKGSYLHAQEHIDRMVPLVNQQTHNQVVAICNDETKKLGAELSQLASELYKVKSGGHSESLKNAINTAVTNLNAASANLDKLSGDDISVLSSGYFKAIKAAHKEARTIHSAGTCPEIDPVLVKGLHDITHLFNDYQDKLYAVIGIHDTSEQYRQHHHHQSHGAAGHQSSEQSAKSAESLGHSH